MRILMLSAAALLLASCGGETYPVAAGEAYTTLTGVGTPPGLYPLPGGLYDVAVRFEALPADSAVQWHFSHEGDELARIVATVEPDGDAASNVSIQYVEGSAPDENWRNKQVRRDLQNYGYQLVAEAVDAKFENRSFDMAIRDNAAAMTIAAAAGSMMKDANASIDEAVAQQKERERESEAQSARNPYAATKPTTDLSKFN